MNEVMMCIKVGDYFVCDNDNWGYEHEANRIQQVYGIDDGYVISQFIDTKEKNRFGIKSSYGRSCTIVDKNGQPTLVMYDNGVPMLWVE